MALLITLAVITVLVAVTLEFNRQTRLSLTQTSSFKDRTAARALAAAGIQAGMALLVRDYKDATSMSLQQDWANPEAVSTLLAELDLPEGKLQVRIEDELGKIQLNALIDAPGGQHFNPSQQLLWERFLEIMLALRESAADAEISTIVNSLKDWLDAHDDDAITGLDGAESDYYESLEVPYRCRNGPIPRLEELLLVRGITSELFYGDGAAPGLKPFLTVHGLRAREDSIVWPGRININTAPLPVLAALLPPGAEELALEMVEYRLERAHDTYLHDLEQPLWYHNVVGLGGVTLNNITTTSDTFRIQAVAGGHQAPVRITAVIQLETHGEQLETRGRVISWLED